MAHNERCATNAATAYEEWLDAEGGFTVALTAAEYRERGVAWVDCGNLCCICGD